MAEIVYDCPRCKSLKTTLDVTYQHSLFFTYNWKSNGELQCVCRACRRGSILVIEQSAPTDYIERAWKDGLQNQKGNINEYLEISGYVSLKDEAPSQPPEHLPPDIETAFREGAACLAIKCFNAAAAMFRLCVDHATNALLPQEDIQGLNARIRRSLGLRIDWLFQAGHLPAALQDLSNVIKDNGNDGAHDGTVTKEDAEDILDFTTALLERLYTDPRKVELARERRELRRQ